MYGRFEGTMAPTLRYGRRTETIDGTTQHLTAADRQTTTHFVCKHKENTKVLEHGALGHHLEMKHTTKSCS